MILRRVRTGSAATERHHLLRLPSLCDTPPVCARFTLMMPWADVVRLLGGEVRAQVHGKPSWNVAPTQQIAMIEESGTGRHLTPS